MRKPFSILVCFISFCHLNVFPSGSLKLNYNFEAKKWYEAFPMGNGRIGAMIFGDPLKELIQLNENTLYSGDPSLSYKDVVISNESFKKVDSLMRFGNYIEAQNIVGKKWQGRLHQSYQPFGDIHIFNNLQGTISGYKRELNISESVSKIEYRQNGIGFTREMFISYPDQVMVLHFKATRKKSLDFTVYFSSPHKTATCAFQKNRGLILQGKAPGLVERRTFDQIESWNEQYKHPELYYSNGKRKFDHRVLYGNEIDNKGMTFEGVITPKFIHQGKIKYSVQGLRIYDTDDMYLVVSLATSFNGYDKNPVSEGLNPQKINTDYLNKANGRSYTQLYNRHVADYKKLFDKVALHLKSDSTQLALPTNERIIRFGSKPDPDLCALVFQFGRYLIISGSRGNGQPLNLQGIWNKDTIPAWNCGYTTNINVQMNYWPVETTNLQECISPLFRLIDELSVTGKECAQKMYNRPGWVVHHNTSIWREAYPNDWGPAAPFWPMAQGWLTSHLWEHFLFSCDTLFLRQKAYPLMKSVAEFYKSWLVKDENGKYVTPVSISPENTFMFDGTKKASMSMGSTMDMSIIRENFERTIRAGRIIKIDSAFCNELEGMLPLLLGFQVGSKGQLQEWKFDFQEAEPTHRHVSHLYGLYPGDQIAASGNPTLFNAAKKTLELRGDGATGWSMGWKINLWARLLDGDHAYLLIKNLFTPSGFGPDPKLGAGLTSSLLDMCPPFQIDGNQGYTAGISEMLLQSQNDMIHLLPALPRVWDEGHVRGLRARGAFETEIHWKHGKLAGATVHSLKGNICRICYKGSFEVFDHKGNCVQSTRVIKKMAGADYQVREFKTSKEQTYFIKPVVENKLL